MNWDALGPKLLEATAQTLGLVSLSFVLGGLGGLLLGTALYVTREGGIFPSRLAHTALNVLVNLVRPIPFLIFLAAVQPLSRVVVGTGIGDAAMVFAISLAATFGISRIVEQNLLTVSPGVLEASRAAGASRMRTLWSVVLPEALGPLILGYTFVIVALVDMSAVAGYVGGGGLGAFAIQWGYRQFDPLVTWSAVLIIIALVQLVQLLGNRLARRVMRR